ncbi:MAG TPA: hypothetical protein DEF41_04975 [Desulfovibrio sp.]|uniref:Uncharacterized protein n=1 Tax=Nitratidesulfovibrio vulgaris (strain ATCC 29579 / DSM 644 / CCUG 34227 / NCIMB 8303 / VKM B-1760 / Hildenborough) TaxID=882 RepID=Q72AS5_NITV2|nr:hypothetical protein DVU_1916 [Nitratidesulfovibrio vulgaris str. Hildenborough]HBW15486.1 hypothetical protein [Desulfovibrio sp.]
MCQRNADSESSFSSKKVMQQHCKRRLGAQTGCFVLHYVRFVSF